MRHLTSFIFVLTIAFGTLSGCSAGPSKSPDVAGGIRTALDQAGLKSVSVSQDRDKGVVSLTGQVPSDSDKAQAETIANSMAAGQVVADQIAVVPPGAEHDAKAMNSDLDEGIEKNLDAALIQNGLKRTVDYNVKSGVVTLKGEVNSESKRAYAQKVAASVPNVQQVVNELQVKDQKASSTR